MDEGNAVYNAYTHVVDHPHAFSYDNALYSDSSLQSDSEDIQTRQSHFEYIYM
jgi:hypothetical protein